MTYRKTWHPEYAAESIKRYERDFGANANGLWISYAIECGQVAELAHEVGNVKISAIATTVGEIIAASHDLGSRSRRKITEKQRAVLARALQEKFQSARAIANRAWGLSDDDITNADA